MKYRLLMSGGSSAIVSEFFRFTDTKFKCLTTSSCITDILNHFEILQPDAYICFIDVKYDEALSQIEDIKENSVYNGAPVIVVGSVEVCNAIESRPERIPDLLIKRPISTDNLALSIVRFLEKRAETAKSHPAEIPASAEVSPVHSAPAEAPAKKHILVVDDDRSILKLLKSALSDEYEVTAMLNGVLVDKFLDSRSVDLIILDYEMPIETGADVFRRIKNNKKAENIPVCFLT